MLRETKAGGPGRGRRVFLPAFSFLLFAFVPPGPAARAQDVADKMVATVNSGVRPSLITYSELGASSGAEGWSASCQSRSE